VTLGRGKRRAARPQAFENADLFLRDAEE